MKGLFKYYLLYPFNRQHNKAEQSRDGWDEIHWIKMENDAMTWIGPQKIAGPLPVREPWDPLLGVEPWQQLNQTNNKQKKTVASTQVNTCERSVRSLIVFVFVLSSIKTGTNSSFLFGVLQFVWLDLPRLGSGSEWWQCVLQKHAARPKRKKNTWIKVQGPAPLAAPVKSPQLVAMFWNSIHIPQAPGQLGRSLTCNSPFYSMK